MKEILQDTACLKKGEIQRYLAEESPQEEIRRVENHLLDCPLCNDALEGFEGYYGFETDKDIDWLEQALAEKTAILEGRDNPKVVSVQRRNRLITLNRIAATVLLLILPAAAWFYMNNNTPTRVPEYGTDSAVRSGEGTTSAALFNVIKLYEAEQYEAALTAAQEILITDQEDVKATYYAGLSAYRAGEYLLAADYFMTVRLNSDFYYQDATWMEAQSYVGAKDTVNAILLLDGIIQKKDGYFYKDAIALRKQLN